MKKNLLIFLIFICLNVFAQSTSFEIVEEMGRGINLGNVLSAPTEGNWAFSVYEEYFEQVKDEGFSNVRIPVDFFGGSFFFPWFPGRPPRKGRFMASPFLCSARPF